MAREADFTNDTRERIAKRAGHRCSYRGCDRTTIGPGCRSQQFENIGEAAHIFSSAPDGPQGAGGLSLDQRKHPQNEIWLCRTHAKMIDSHEGDRYRFKMQRWKAVHEARIDHEHRGLPVPSGSPMNLEMRHLPLFCRGATIDFG